MNNEFTMERKTLDNLKPNELQPEIHPPCPRCWTSLCYVTNISTLKTPIILLLCPSCKTFHPPLPVERKECGCLEVYADRSRFKPITSMHPDLEKKYNKMLVHSYECERCREKGRKAQGGEKFGTIRHVR